MSVDARAEVIEKVQTSILPVKTTLAEVDMPRSNYHGWIRQKQCSALASL